MSKRESHDASGSYRRFTPPDLSSDTEVAPYQALDKLIVGDARRMDAVSAFRTPYGFTSVAANKGPLALFIPRVLVRTFHPGQSRGLP